MANKVLGILNFEPSYVHVEGIENYRPASATSVLDDSRYSILSIIVLKSVLKTSFPPFLSDGNSLIFPRLELIKKEE